MQFAGQIHFFSIFRYLQNRKKTYPDLGATPECWLTLRGTSFLPKFKIVSLQSKYDFSYATLRKFVFSSGVKQLLGEQQ